MGASIKEQFSSNFIYNIFGVITGTSTITQFPSGTAKLLRFKADPDNNDDFMLGSYDAINSGECPWPLAPGDDTGWIAAPAEEGNRMGLQNFTYRAISGSLDYLYYWIQR